MKIPEIDLYLIAPEIIITAFGFLVLLVDVFLPKEERKSYLGIRPLGGALVRVMLQEQGHHLRSCDRLSSQRRL